MGKTLHNAVILLLFSLLFSCSSPETQDAKKVQLPVVIPHETVEPAKPIAKKELDVVFSGQTTLEKDFQYETSVQQTVGEFVSAPMSAVEPRNTNVGYQPDANLNDRQIMEHFPDFSPVTLRIVFDNDIFDNTDYYYTNGVRIELALPFTDRSPINKILAGFKTPDVGLSGFAITQNIYTPINPEAIGIEYGDRPFAGYLTLGQFRENYLFQRRLYIKSAIDLGILGPASLGGRVQSSVHYLEPTGWAYQIQNSFIINYYFHIEKGLYSSPNLEVNVLGEANAGTLYDKIGGGISFRTGSFMQVYRGPLTACCGNTKKREWQYWFFMSGVTDFVGWDATLQGGLFNQKSPYVLASSEISRIVFRASAGVAVYYHRFGMELENFYLTPEFEGGRSFMYGRIKLAANF